MRLAAVRGRQSAPSGVGAARMIWARWISIWARSLNSSFVGDLLEVRHRDRRVDSVPGAQYPSIRYGRGSSGVELHALVESFVGLVEVILHHLQVAEQRPQMERGLWS